LHTHRHYHFAPPHRAPHYQAFAIKLSRFEK
jgi:hypothetical protein